MSLLDDLKKTLTRKAAEQTAEQAKSSAARAVEALADDFLDAAEGALERARTERGQQEAIREEAEESSRAFHEARMDRKKKAAEELARLKALRDAKDP